MHDLRDRVARVADSSRGGGKAIAVVLGERGATVYVTGRSVRAASLRRSVKRARSRTPQRRSAAYSRSVPQSSHWPPLFDHVTLRVRDLSLSRAFYEQALKPFGVRVVQSSQGPLGFATDDRGDFWIKEETPTAGPVHIAFAARDRATVDAFHTAAVKAGGVDNGPPGLRPHYHPGYYAAFVLDPDGNNVEAVFNGDR